MQRLHPAEPQRPACSAGEADGGNRLPGLQRIRARPVRLDRPFQLGTRRKQRSWGPSAYCPVTAQSLPPPEIRIVAGIARDMAIGHHDRGRNGDAAADRQASLFADSPPPVPRSPTPKRTSRVAAPVRCDEHSAATTSPKIAATCRRARSDAARAMRGRSDCWSDRGANRAAQASRCGRLFNRARRVR